MKRVATLLTTLVWLALAAGAQASPWAQRQGHGQLITQLTFYQTSDGFDANGRSFTFGSNGKFTKFEINPYFEYGILDRLTLVGSLFIPFLTFEDTFGRRSNSGIGDMELGLRYGLTAADSPLAFSLQGLVKFPLYARSGDPPLGGSQVDLELRALLGQGFNLGSMASYWALEAAFRKRMAEPGDEFRFDATLGVGLTEQLQVLGQVFTITGLGNGTPYFTGTNVLIDPNFNLYKVQLSLVYKITEQFRLQGGWANHFAGRNTGGGSSFLGAFWWEF